MPYQFLPTELHETADAAKKHFAKTRSVTGYLCESQIKGAPDLPLRPTWQGQTRTHYHFCLEVRQDLKTSTLADFVAKCAARKFAIHLWVALPSTVGMSSLGKELKDAKELGIGVVRIVEDGTIHEDLEAVSLSLFGLHKTDRGSLTKPHWEGITRAERQFLGGNPEGACQELGKQLEEVTRKFADYSFKLNWWKQSAKAPNLTGNWSPLLETLEQQIVATLVQSKYPAFKRQQITAVRGHTGQRNVVSHPPKNAKERRERDQRLRTMFESMRDTLVDWCEIARALKLK